MSDAGAKRQPKPDWVTQIADRVIRRFERQAPRPGREGTPKVVCASGISPSGPIHLGNLRELMVPHYVVEEIRSRGIECEHLHSWDDYDRLRKVPAGVDESFDRHIGRPLSEVPDPEGGDSSWAERFKAPLREAMERLGVELREVSQSEMYRQGAYRQQIVTALSKRTEINEVLARYRTLESESGADDAPATEAEDGGDETSEDYWPYKVYCQSCGKDLTTITGIEPGETSYWISYRCDDCGHVGRFDLMVENHGKLVWKVDWPMRWAYEGVTFEAAGADHSSPGSSTSVGRELVAAIYGGEAPEYEAYSFVGTTGSGKMSSSKGAVPTPLDALAVFEVPILRWMYVRKSPRQSFSVDLASGIYSIYDDWDAFSRKVASGEAAPSQEVTYHRARTTHLNGELPVPDAIVPFRTLTSAVSVAAGDETQLARIVGELTEVEADEVARTEPRLSLARSWVDDFAPDSERIRVREAPDRERLSSLSDQESAWLKLLLDHLGDDWSLEGAKSLVYGVPKMAAGLPLDTPPSPELKTEQRAFFKLLYELLLSADTGPRMPTLLMALGEDRVRHLLG
jgi:lysyl-tRNA synthetase class 1